MPNWLDALFVCPLTVDAEVVLAELRSRGLRVRGVPTGPARQAYTATGREGTIGVIVTGTGLVAARRCAAAWAPRTRRIVVVSAGLGTQLVPAGSVVVDGEQALVTRATEAGGDPPVLRGRIATVTNPTEAGEAQSSLAALGIAAADAEAGPWRDAANPQRQPILLVRALINDDGEHLRAQRLVGPGQARPGWGRLLLHTLRNPGDARVWRRAAFLAEPLRRAAAQAGVRAIVVH